MIPRGRMIPSDKKDLMTEVTSVQINLSESNTFKDILNKRVTRKSSK